MSYAHRRSPRSFKLWIVPLISTILVSSGCGPNHEEVRLTFDNHTDSPLCFYRYPEDIAGGCRQEVEPLTNTAWRPGCGYGEEADRAPLTVLLTVREGGRQIYNRTAECRVWQNSDRKFVIERRGDEFVVTDSLPDAKSSP
jgi:hypothetical protein